MDSFAKYKHFMFRAAFGLGPKELQGSMPSSVEQFVHDLLEPSLHGQEKDEEMNPGEPLYDRRTFLSMDRQERMKVMETDRDRIRDLRSKWIYQMASDDTSGLRERMTLFWHGHLACQSVTSMGARSYLSALRKHALGNVKDLVLAVAKEPSMLRFLNNQQNRRGHPNENFARELLELFTIGVGNYTEGDVQEAARAFTGWGMNKEGTFQIRRLFHDPGQKHFMGTTGRLNGYDIIDIVFSKRETAHHICNQLYRYFVNIKPNQEHIDQMAKVMFEADYDMIAVMYFMFTQDWFYDPVNVGTKIKSPIDLIVHAMKILKITFDSSNSMTFLQRGLGQVLFSPPNVAGWPGGRSWINNATMMLRLNMVNFLLYGKRFDHATTTPLEAMEADNPVQVIKIKYDDEPLLSVFAGVSYDKLEQEMKMALLAVEESPSLSNPRQRREPDFRKLLLARITAIPEFQMC